MAMLVSTPWRDELQVNEATALITLLLNVPTSRSQSSQLFTRFIQLYPIS
jgi:hypothetical protein